MTEKYHFLLWEDPKHPLDMTYGPMFLLLISFFSISQKSSVRIYMQLLGISPKWAFSSVQNGQWGWAGLDDGVGFHFQSLAWIGHKWVTTDAGNVLPDSGMRISSSEIGSFECFASWSQTQEQIILSHFFFPPFLVSPPFYPTFLSCILQWVLTPILHFCLHLFLSHSSLPFLHFPFSISLHLYVCIRTHTDMQTQTHKYTYKLHRDRSRERHRHRDKERERVQCKYMLMCLFKFRIRTFWPFWL